MLLGREVPELLACCWLCPRMQRMLAREGEGGGGQQGGGLRGKGQRLGGVQAPVAEVCPPQQQRGESGQHLRMWLLCLDVTKNSFFFSSVAAPLCFGARFTHKVSFLLITTTFWLFTLKGRAVI